MIIHMGRPEHVTRLLGAVISSMFIVFSTAACANEQVQSEPDPPLDAKAMEEYFELNLEYNFLDGIDSMCETDHLHWSCFYQGVEAKGNALQVNLTPDDDWQDFELDDLAESAGGHWMNFVGCEYPQLETVIVNINGELYKTHRDEFPDMCEIIEDEHGH